MKSNQCTPSITQLKTHRMCVKDEPSQSAHSITQRRQWQRPCVHVHLLHMTGCQATANRVYIGNCPSRPELARRLIDPYLAFQVCVSWQPDTQVHVALPVPLAAYSDAIKSSALFYSQLQVFFCFFFNHLKKIFFNEIRTVDCGKQLLHSPLFVAEVSSIKYRSI